MSLLHDLCDELTIRLGAPVGISDLQFDTLAAGPHPLDVDWMRRDSLVGRVAPHTSQEYFRQRGVVPGMPGPLLTEADPAHGIESRWIIPVRCVGRTHGYIWVVNPAGRPVPAEAITAVAPYADQAGEHLHRRHTELRDHAASLRDLLTSHREIQKETAARLYEVAGFPTGAVAVLVINVVTEHGGRADPPRDVLDGPFPRAIAGDVWRLVEGNRAIVLVPPGTVARAGSVQRVAEHALQVTQRAVGPTATVVVGIGDSAESLYEAGSSFRQARLAARAAAALENVPTIAAWRDLGAIRAVLSIPDDQLDGAIAPGVDALCAEASFLAETVETYFATGGNVNETAERLSVSRGTIYYRLQRAEAVSGLSLKSGPDRMTLEIGLAMTRLRDRTTRRVSGPVAGQPRGATDLAR